MKHLILSLSFAGLLLVGCGDQKADKAVDRILAQKNPGFVRVVNLTAGPVEYWYKNRHVSPTIPSMDTSDLLPIGTGDQTVRIEIGTKKIEVKVKLSTGIGETIILMPDQTTKFIDNEQRYATADSNVRIVPVDAGGKLPGTVAFTGADTKSMPVKDSLITLNQGMINAPDGSPLEIKDRIAYNLFIVATPKKVYYILSKNASDKKPVSQGQSAA